MSKDRCAKLLIAIVFIIGGDRGVGVESSLRNDKVNKLLSLKGCQYVWMQRELGWKSNKHEKLVHKSKPSWLLLT